MPKPNRFAASVPLCGRPARTYLHVYVCPDGLVEVVMVINDNHRRLVLDRTEAGRLVEALTAALPHAEDD